MRRNRVGLCSVCPMTDVGTRDVRCLIAFRPPSLSPRASSRHISKLESGQRSWVRSDVSPLPHSALRRCTANLAFEGTVGKRIGHVIRILNQGAICIFLKPSWQGQCSEFVKFPRDNQTIKPLNIWCSATHYPVFMWPYASANLLECPFS